MVLLTIPYLCELVLKVLVLRLDGVELRFQELVLFLELLVALV
jgi:hypothetical protein